MHARESGKSHEEQPRLASARVNPVTGSAVQQNLYEMVRDSDQNNGYKLLNSCFQRSFVLHLQPVFVDLIRIRNVKKGGMRSGLGWTWKEIASQ